MLLQLGAAESKSILIPFEDKQKEEEEDVFIAFEVLLFGVFVFVELLTKESLGDCGDGDTDEEEFIDATELCGDSDDDDEVDDDDGNFEITFELLSLCSIKLLL